MTKHIRYVLFLSTLLFTLLPASAIRYRGFVDAAPGTWVFGDKNFSSDKEYFITGETLPVYFNTTHGIQFSNLFYAGVGGGVRYKMKNISPQAYTDFRFDFNSYRNNHPYMDCRLGMLMFEEPVDGVDALPFASIGFGYRIKLNNVIGFNIGLGLINDLAYGYYNGAPSYYNDFSSLGVAMSINLGIDF